MWLPAMTCPVLNLWSEYPVWWLSISMPVRPSLWLLELVRFILWPFFCSHMLGQLTFDMFYFLGGHIIGPMRSLSYTRWSFRASVSLLSSCTSRAQLLSPIPPSATASPGTTLWTSALSRAATRKLFIEWGPHLYFYVSVKHLTLQKAMASSCPTWFARAIFILVSKGIMSLGIKIHQHMCTRKNIGVMFIGL